MDLENLSKILANETSLKMLGMIGFCFLGPASLILIMYFVKRLHSDPNCFIAMFANLSKILANETLLKMLGMIRFCFLGPVSLILIMYFLKRLHSDPNCFFDMFPAILGEAQLELLYSHSSYIRHSSYIARKKPRSRPTDELQNQLLTLLLLKIVDKELKSFLKEKKVSVTYNKPGTPCSKKYLLPEVEAPILQDLQPGDFACKCKDFPSPAEAKEVNICGEYGEELAPLNLLSPLQEDIISFSTHPELPALDEMMKPAYSQLSPDTLLLLPCSSDTESKSSSSSEGASSSFEVISWCQKSSSSDSNSSFEIVSSSDEM